MLFLANSFVTCSTEFVTVCALMLHFNFYATLFNAQHCSVAFNKPYKNVVAYQLIYCANV